MQAQHNPRASWPSGDDNGGFFLLVIVGGLGVLSYVLWTNYHGPISALVMQLFHGEIGLLRHLTDRYDLADRQMAASDPEGVTLADLYGISHAIGLFVRIPAAALILVLAAICMAWATPSRFRRAFDLDGLVREQAISFPVMSAFVSRHLRLLAPAAKPRPGDYALTPGEWIASFATAEDGSFDGAAARRALVLQLGPQWLGVEHADAHVRCLFAVFALHLAERRAEALRLLGRLSAGLGSRDADTPGGPDAPLSVDAASASHADALLRDFALVTPAQAIVWRHAYTHTALMTLLNEARLRAGVLAPGQFAWLKLVDRSLWYALHALGFENEGFGRYLHPNPRAEAIGARDHWAVERVVGEPVREPALDRALDALRAASSSRPQPPADPA